MNTFAGVRFGVASMALALALPTQAELLSPKPFCRPAGECWQDGFFLGDGATGVLAYAPQHLEWVVNRNSVYERNPGRDEELPHDEVLRRIGEMRWKNVDFLSRADRTADPSGAQSTVTPVILRLRFWPNLAWSAPSAPRIRGELDLRDGKLTETLDGALLDRDVETLVSRAQDVLALRVRVQDGKEVPSILDVSRPANVLLDETPAWKREADSLAFEQPVRGNGDYAVAVAWNARALDGGKTAGTDGELWFAPGDVELFVAVRSRRESKRPLADALEAVEAARIRGFDRLQRENANWWNRFWDRGGRVSFDSEPEIGMRWNLALFTMAATYGSSPMPGLNGLAYGPYSPLVAGVGSQGYTHDQNAQIPFFAFLALNRCDWVESFAQTYLDVLPQLKSYTRKRFGCEGVGLPLCMNQDGREIPVKEYRYTLCGSAYSGLVLSLAWRYSRNVGLMRRLLYPLLKEFCLFHLAQMERGDDGRYHHSWSVPPEIFTVTRDDSATLAMLRTDLETLVEMSELLKADADLRLRAREVLAHWPEQSYLDDGAFWAGPDVPKDHYHYGGHLMYPFFPSESQTDEKARVSALKTVDYAQHHGLDWSWRTPGGGPHAKHEWSAYLTGMARIRAGSDGWRALVEYLSWFGKPNGLFSHNAVIVGDCRSAAEAYAERLRSHPNVRRGFDGVMRPYAMDSDDVTENPAAKAKVAMVAESTSAFLQMATETVLQSWGGRIRLFPCVPPNFSGSFTNLLAEGGVLVSATMKEGKVVSQTIVANNRNGEEATGGDCQ